MEEILSQIGEMSPVLIMGLGLAIGLEHAFEPDHVAAVSTQVSKGRFMQKSTKQIIKSGTMRSSILGAFWGAGHTTTLVLMGLLVYALAVKIEQNIFSSLELIVGMMLIFLAITTISNKKIFNYDTGTHTNTMMARRIMMNTIISILSINTLTSHI